MKNILGGIILIAIGLILGLNALEITNINIFFDGWWTLFIIIPTFIGLFDDKDKKGNIIGLIIGILLLLACNDILNFEIVWQLFLPIILIIIGLSWIFKNSINNEISKKIKELNEKGKSENEYFATFSSQKYDFSNEEFEGCNLTSSFGGLELNLKKSIIKKDIVININATFGGVKIITPDNVNIKINSNSIFGGVENKTKNKDNNDITIYINSICLFGGVEIK